MAEQLEIAEQGRAALLRSRNEALQVARAYVKNPEAPNTRRVYETAVHQWTRYCDALGIPWGPIDPEELCVYLTGLGKTLAPNTVRLHMSALVNLDKACRVTATNRTPESIRKDAIFARWYQGWSREHPARSRKQAAALDLSDLERLIRTAAEKPRTVGAHAHALRYVRDRSLLLLGVGAALRGAELAALELADVQRGADGLTITVRRSKTDQAGVSEPVGVSPQARVSICPVAAFDAWLVLRGQEPGPLYQAIDRAGEYSGAALSERQIRQLVATYAKRAGLTVAISSHSLRATLATLASGKGHGLERIMKHGRWKSAAIAARYVRQGQLFRDNVTGGLFD